ncbi:TniQ [compost metagenome]
MRRQLYGFEDGACGLPFQDEIRAGESGQGYALRMACSNGLDGIGRLMQWLGRTHAAAVLTAADAPALAEYFGASLPRLTLALEHLREGRRELGSRYAGHTMGRCYFLNRSHPRVCPMCLQELGYCRVAWDFSLVVACSRHGCALLERCPACGRALSWNRPSLRGCRCGYLWDGDVPVAATPGERMMASLVDQWMEDFESSSQVSIGSESKGSEEAMILAALFRGISLDGVMRVAYALATAAAYDQDLPVQYRERGLLCKDRQTVALVVAFGAKVARQESLRLRKHRPSVLMDLLGDISDSRTVMPADQSLAQSMLRGLLANPPTSKMASKHALLAQRALF